MAMLETPTPRPRRRKPTTFSTTSLSEWWDKVGVTMLSWVVSMPRPLIFRSLTYGESTVSEKSNKYPMPDGTSQLPIYAKASLSKTWFERWAGSKTHQCEGWIMQLSSGHSSRPQFSINHIRCHGMMYLKTTSGHQQRVTSWYVSIFNTTGPGMILPVAPLKPSRKSEFQIQYLGESFQHTHTMVPADQTPAELQQELANETSSRHVRDLWAAFHQSFQKVWQQRVQALPKQPPGKEQANLTFQSWNNPFVQASAAVCQAAESWWCQPRLRRRGKNQGNASSNCCHEGSCQNHLRKWRWIANHLTYDPCPLQCDQEISANEIQEHPPGHLTLAHEAAVEAGDQLFQQTMKGDGYEASKAFADLWNPLWNRHHGQSPERWNQFVHKLVTSWLLRFRHAPKPCKWNPSQQPSGSPASALRKVMATGPDGLASHDTSHHWSPSCLSEDMTQMQRHSHGQRKPSHAGLITAVEKREDAACHKDFRPITALSIPYRTGQRMFEVLRQTGHLPAIATVWLCPDHWFMHAPCILACLPAFVRAWHWATSEISRWWQEEFCLPMKLALDIRKATHCSPCIATVAPSDAAHPCCTHLQGWMAEDANDRLLRTANKYLVSFFEHTEQPEDLL